MMRASDDGLRLKSKESVEDVRGRIRRRDLLAWGGAAAMLPSLEGIARAQEAIAEAAAAGPQPMSVGYIVGSETWAPLRNVTAGFLNRGVKSDDAAAPQPAEIVPATSLVAGSQELAGQSVKVRVHGLYPVPNPQDAETVYLTALFSGVEAGLPGSVPFLAFGYKSKPAPDVPAPIAFTYPLGAMGTLDFQLDVKPARGSRVSRRALAKPVAVGGRFTTTFTVDWFAGKPKLQRGVYLLGLAGKTWTSARTLPIVKAGQQRPLELLSLVVSFEPIAT